MADQQGPTPEEQLNEQSQQQTGQRQVMLQVDERNLNTAYANTFRSNATAEEVIIDFGLNQVVPVNREAGAAEDTPKNAVRFEVKQRVIMNYFSAKRLAISLSQVIRRHEDQFGELKLNVAERQIHPPSES